jgi:hypothetical protein
MPPPGNACIAILRLASKEPEALNEVATDLRNRLRPGDRLFKRDKELVLVLQDVDRAGAERIVSDLLPQLSAAGGHQGLEYVIACNPADAASFDESLNRGDALPITLKGRSDSKSSIH